MRCVSSLVPVLVYRAAVRRGAVPPHPVNAPAERRLDPQGDAPEAVPAVQLLHVEEPDAQLRDPPVADLDQRPDHEPAPLEARRRVAGGVNGPSGDSEDRILQVRPERAKVGDPLLLRPLGTLQPIVETVTAGGPCTF